MADQSPKSGDATEAARASEDTDGVHTAAMRHEAAANSVDAAVDSILRNSAGSGSGAERDSTFVFVDAQEGKSPVSGEGAQPSSSDDKKSWRSWNLFSGSRSGKDGAKEESRASQLKRSLSSKVPFFKSKDKEPEQKKEAEPPKELVAEVGARVRVFGLVKAAQYNESRGVIREVIDGGERFVVLLEGQEERQLSVKRSNICVTAAPERRADGAGAGAMLKIAASRILGPKVGGGNYYEELGLEASASAQDIRHAYYRLAKAWHPDKNKGDPAAEERFKRISEAYSILSDPARRRLYDQHGAAGVEGEVDVEHFKGFARSLFGGGEFDAVFGDVCELPLFKDLLHSLAHAPAPAGGVQAEEAGERAARMKELVKEEERYVEGLGEGLKRRLEGRARGEVSKAEFYEATRAWARQVVRAPGGGELLELVGQVYRRKARKMTPGFTAALQQMKDLKNRVAEGSSLLVGALRASAMAHSLSKQLRPSRKEGKGGGVGGGEGQQGAVKSAGEAPPPNPSPAPPNSPAPHNTLPDHPAPAAPARNAEQGAGMGGWEGGGKEGEEEVEVEGEEMLDVDPEEVRKFARHSIGVVWRLGLFLLQKRLRAAVDALTTRLNNTPPDNNGVGAGGGVEKERGGAGRKEAQAQVAAYAAALLELGEACGAEGAAYSLEVGEAEGAARGAPVHLADQLADHVAQAREAPKERSRSPPAPTPPPDPDPHLPFPPAHARV